MKKRWRPEEDQVEFEPRKIRYRHYCQNRTSTLNAFRPGPVPAGAQLVATIDMTHSSGEG